MKKLFLILVLAVLGVTAKAQAVSDMAVIPIGVTLNSIARLTVTSGGNIEFVVNTMDQYENGVDKTPATTTTFSVASSCKFYVTLAADNEQMQGTVNSSHKMPASIVEYTMDASAFTEATKKPSVPTGEYIALTNTEKGIIGDQSTPNAAGVFSGVKIAWSLAKSTANKDKLKEYASDRYVVNAFLQLHQELN